MMRSACLASTDQRTERRRSRLPGWYAKPMRQVCPGGIGRRSFALALLANHPGGTRVELEVLGRLPLIVGQRQAVRFQPLRTNVLRHRQQHTDHRIGRKAGA
jgi:hypothetical protein